jgi:hypothetical protein
MGQILCLRLKLISLRRLRDGVAQVIKGLEALGFEINTESRPDGDHRFDVQRWGHAQEEALWAFLRLHEAYQVMAPAICPKLEGYARTVYRIFTGTDLRIETVSPRLAANPSGSSWGGTAL